jgi:hypothetical protein
MKNTKKKRPKNACHKKQLFRPSLQRNPLDILQIFAHAFFFYQKWEFSGPKSADIVYVLLLLSALLAKLYLKQVGFPVF